MGDRKYKAFISYSHADEAWAGWLQRSLERFRAPRALAAELAASGRSARLTPVFRDREDLPVAGSLNTAIQAAIADSEYQIVLCSPNSAKSRWVNEEIKLFHRLHGPGRVFALIIGGAPNAANLPGREDEECFPPALRFELDDTGEPTAAAAEPLAADARPSGDGKRYALLKVAAGMLGVGLDDLVRRDAIRRARQARTVAIASLAGSAAAAALAAYAVRKGNEAAVMRGKAETLIEFMLTDLNEKLEPVGRLDILESVVDRANAYYADQNPRSLDDDALSRRAKAMMQLGTIDYRRNAFGSAKAAYETAEKASAELLRRSPKDPDRIFDHAQNVFYVGEAAYRLNDRRRGEAQSFEYLRLARQLMAVDGDNPRSRLELAYATNNIGNTKFRDGLYREAIPYYEASIKARKSLLDADPQNARLIIAYAYAISWQAFAEFERGEFRTAIDLFERQLAAYGGLIEGDAPDFSALDAVVTAQRRAAEAYLALGDIEEAQRRNDAAAETAEFLVAHDPRNANWGVNASHIYRMSSYLKSIAGDATGAMEAAARSVEEISRVITDDAPAFYHAALGSAIAQRLSVSGAGAASAAETAEVDRLIDYAIARDVRDSVKFILDASVILFDLKTESGKAQEAHETALKAMKAVEPLRETLPALAKISLAALMLRTGYAEEAAEIVQELDALGVRHPALMELRGNLTLIARK